MITTARELLEVFDTLPEVEKHHVVVDLLRRSASEGGLSDEAFVEAAEEMFSSLEAEEAKQDANAKRTAG